MTEDHVIVLVRVLSWTGYTLPGNLSLLKYIHRKKCYKFYFYLEGIFLEKEEETERGLVHTPNSCNC